MDKKPNKQEFENIIKETYSMIYNLGLRLFNYHIQEAEDFTQEVFLQVYEKWNSFKKESKISTWIYSLALNLGLNKLRKEKKLKKIILSEEMFSIETKEEKTPESIYMESLDHNHLKEIIQNELRKLPEAYRIPLILFFYEKLSYKEMSKQLGIPEGTLKSLIYRGKLILKEKIKDYKNLLE